MLPDKYDYDIDVNLCSDCCTECDEDYVYCEVCEIMLCLHCIDEHDCVFKEIDFNCEK